MPNIPVQALLVCSISYSAFYIYRNKGVVYSRLITREAGMSP